jgi:hypothetical protein
MMLDMYLFLAETNSAFSKRTLRHAARTLSRIPPCAFFGARPTFQLQGCYQALASSAVNEFISRNRIFEQNNCERFRVFWFREWFAI